MQMMLSWDSTQMSIFLTFNIIEKLRYLAQNRKINLYENTQTGKTARYVYVYENAHLCEQ